MIDACQPSELLAAVAQLKALASDGARGHAFSNELLDELSASLDFETLLGGIAAPDPHVRRVCASLIVGRGRAPDALEAALYQRDMITTMTVAVAALDQAADPTIVLEVLRGSRIAGLRALALYRMQRTGDPRATESSHLGLTDQSPIVRYHAQRFLTQHGVDVRKTYIDALPDDLGALMGLAEVSTAGDVEVLESFLDDERIRARASALHALGRILGDASRDVALAMLSDESASVVRVAGRLLERQSLDHAVLDGLWESSISDRASQSLRRAAFRVFAQQSRWPKLVLAVRALAADDVDVRERGSLMLASTLSAWNSSATEPTVAQLDELREVVPQVRRQLSSRQADELDDLLRRTVGAAG